MATGDDAHRRVHWGAGEITFAGDKYPILAGNTNLAAPVGIGTYLSAGTKYIIFWEKGGNEALFQTLAEADYTHNSVKRVIIAEATTASGADFTAEEKVQLDFKEIAGTTSKLNSSSFNDTITLKARGGSATNPAYSFGQDTNTGMYSSTADQVHFSAGGSERLEVSSAGITVTGAMASSTVSSGNISSTGWFRGDVGTISAPEFSFSVDTDTGVYRAGADILGLAAGGDALSVTAAIRASDSAHFIGLAATGNNDGTDGDAWVNIGTYPTTSDAYNVKPINTILAHQYYAASTGSAAAPAFKYWYDNHTGIYFPGDNQIGISAGGVQKLLYDSSWHMVTAITSGGSNYRDVQVNITDDTIAHITSSARYKEDIKDLAVDTSKIYDLRPVSFKSIGETSTSIGLIAEEVDELIPEIVGYRDGLPDSVEYSRLPIVLLAEIQNLKAEIEELKEAN